MDDLSQPGSAYAGRMTIRPESIGLFAARSRIRSVARDLKFSDEDSTDLLIAVGEALSNAYRHGTPDHASNLIYLGWHLADDVLTVTVRDEGPGIAAWRLEPALPGTGGGWGTHLMRVSMDEVEIDLEGGTRIALKKRLSLRHSHP